MGDHHTLLCNAEYWDDDLGLASSKSCGFQFCFCGGLRVAVTVGDRRAVAMDFEGAVACSKFTMIWAIST